MLWLPPLTAGCRQCPLPVSDRSALVLEALLLDDGGAATVRRLAEELAGDPPAVVWAVCRAADSEEPPRTVADVAGRLARRVRDLLQWPDDRIEADASESAEPYAACVAAGVQLARLASMLAGPNGSPAADEAHLLGLLDDAEQWLAPLGAEASQCLPAWLARRRREPPSAPVVLARRILQGQGSSPAEAPVDLDRLRVEAEERARRWREEVPGAARCLPRLAARLARLAALEHDFQETLQREKLDALAEFAAGAGHEINNPLTVIAGRAQLFLHEEKDPERRRALALINAQTMRIYEMIADLRLFARPPQPERKSLELVGLIDRVLEELSPRAAEQGIRMARCGDPGPVPLEADPAQLAVALKAVCTNALEAIGREGHVEGELRRADGRVEVRIRDDGPGLTPEERAHMFEPFYSARQAGRGLGLGLSKSWRIVTGHGGRLDVESQPGAGATFVITLPAG